jgi:hypothetical protein
MMRPIEIMSISVVAMRNGIAAARSLRRISFFALKDFY